MKKFLLLPSLLAASVLCSSAQAKPPEPQHVLNYQCFLNQVKASCVNGGNIDNSCVVLHVVNPPARCIVNMYLGPEIETMIGEGNTVTNEAARKREYDLCMSIKKNKPACKLLNLDK